MYSTLDEYAAWLLRQQISALSPRAVFNYGPVMSMVLHRDGNFQTELFIVRPGDGFPLEHRHPNINSLEVLFYGRVPLTINGRLARAVAAPGDSGLKSNHVAPTDWHGASKVHKGGSFFSVQEWLNGVEPSSAGLDWEGKFVSVEQEKLVLAARVAGIVPGVQAEGRL